MVLERALSTSHVGVASLVLRTSTSNGKRVGTAFPSVAVSTLCECVMPSHAFQTPRCCMHLRLLRIICSTSLFHRLAVAFRDLSNHHSSNHFAHIIFCNPPYFCPSGRQLLLPPSAIWFKVSPLSTLTQWQMPSRSF